MTKQTKVEVAKKFVAAHSDWTEKDISFIVRDFLDNESLLIFKIRSSEDALRHLEECWKAGA